MIAAGRAAKGKGPLPPQLWKAQHTAPIGWSEFDRMPYRDIVLLNALQTVYDVVSLWVHGKAAQSPDVMKVYAQLVQSGIVGKNI